MSEQCITTGCNALANFVATVTVTTPAGTPLVTHGPYHRCARCMVDMQATAAASPSRIHVTSALIGEPA